MKAGGTKNSSPGSMSVLKSFATPAARSTVVPVDDPTISPTAENCQPRYSPCVRSTCRFRNGTSEPRSSATLLPPPPSDGLLGNFTLQYCPTGRLSTPPETCALEPPGRTWVDST